MHAVLAAAIANPRFARPYGSERGEWGFPEGATGSDHYIRNNTFGWSGETDQNALRTIASGRARAIGTHGLH